MRKLSELIVLIRGGGEIGTAIAHRMVRSHFRVCIAETDQPLAVNRGSCFSEALYENSKTIEGVTAEKTITSLENIYKIWRNNKIPVVSDPDLTVKPIILPDVLINAMMLERESSTKINDAPLVIGIGSGFEAGENVHMVIESNKGNDLGKVLITGKSSAKPDKPQEIGELIDSSTIWSVDAGVFTPIKNIGDSVTLDEIIGKIDDVPLKSPCSGVIRGQLRNQTKVLANTKIAEIDTTGDKTACYSICDSARAIAGGVLEAIMIAYNVE